MVVLVWVLGESQATLGMRKKAFRVKGIRLAL
jgi:hypothetical protein